MNTKIEKINVEYEKNKTKIAELQSRQRELERQRKEIENNEILGLVESYNLDAVQLAELLNGLKKNPYLMNDKKGEKGHA